MSRTMSANGSAGSKRRLMHDERRLPLQALLRRVREPDAAALVEATADHEAVHRGVLVEDLRDRPHEQVLDRDRRVGVRDVELADVGVGVAHRDLLLEVDGRLVPPPHEVRHDRPWSAGRSRTSSPSGRRQSMAADATHRPSRRQAPGLPRGGTVVGWRSPTCSRIPTWSRSRCWRSPVGFLALHGGLEPGTAEIAGEAARRSGTSWYTIVQPDDLKHHVPSHENDPARRAAARRVPRPRRRGGLGARLLGARRPARRAARRWRRPRARGGVGRVACGRRCPTTS